MKTRKFSELRDNIKKSISEAQREKDPHAGPGNSFPLDAKHLKAAWDLAGHEKNPDEVRRKVLAFARQHNLEHLLPESAREHIMKAERYFDTLLEKAKTSDIEQLFDLAWQHESEEGDDYQKRQLVRFADSKGMLNLLPESAHAKMHEMGVGHNHEGIENDEDGRHEHMVTKAALPVTGYDLIVKSWTDEQSGDVHYEGWLSTPRRDLQKDIIEPEAFIDCLPGYFQRSAPVSVVHDKTKLPAGHLRKAAVIRDGKVLLEAAHPTDPGDFTVLPKSGSGVWVLGRLTEEPAKGAVRKGNCGGMSFIANGTEYQPISGGGKRWFKMNPMMESTVAPYPINPDAYMAVIKSFGFEYQAEQSTEETQTTMGDELKLPDAFLELFAGIETQAKEKEAEEAAKVQKAADANTFLAKLDEQIKKSVSESVESKVSAEVAKVFDTMRSQASGNGKQSTIKKAESLEDNPVEYVLSKANEVGHESLSLEDKDFIAELTKKVLTGDLRSE